MRRRRQGLQVSTFPFLAVLLCAMGSLILLLLVIDRRAKAVARMKAMQAMSRVKEDDARAAAAKKAEWEGRRRALHALLQQEDQQLVDQIQAVKGNARTHEDRITAKEAEFRKLEATLAEAAARLKRGQGELAARRAALGTESGNKEKASRDLVQLTEELSLLEQTVRELKRLHERDQQTYSLIPYLGKRGDNRKPIYIECAAGRLIFHPQGTVLEGGRVTVTDVLAEVQRQIARQRTMSAAAPTKKSELPYLLMLVRPNGITTYFKTLSVLQGMQFEYGYEFVDQDWVLDFSEEGEKRPDWMMAAKAPVPKSPSKSLTPLAIKPRGIPREGKGVFGERTSGEDKQAGFGDGGPALGTARPIPIKGSLGGSPGLTSTSGSLGTTGVAGTGVGKEGGAFRSIQGVHFGTGGSREDRAAPQSPLTVFIGRPSILGDGRSANGTPVARGADPWSTKGGGLPGENGEGPSLGPTVRGAGDSARSGDPTAALGSPAQDGKRDERAGIREGDVPGGSGARPGMKAIPPTQSGNANQKVEGGVALLTAEPAESSGPPIQSGAISKEGAAPGAVSGTPSRASQPGNTVASIPANGARGDTQGAGSPGQGTAPNDGPRAGGKFFEPGAEGVAAGDGQAGRGGTGSSGPGSGGQGNQEGTQGESAGSGIVGLAPRGERSAKPARPMPISLSRLIGNRDWIIPVECRADGVVLRTARLQFPASALVPAGNGTNPLTQAVSQMIARRQATVRAGDPPYRPVLQLQVQPEGTRVYYLAYPLLQGLGVRMSRRDQEPVEKKTNVD